uniref:Uncharacterized protein n=1 Tax=Anguilla anguilla TaxID=7936 RepID=A0A0E9QDF7_ANGAN
MLRIHCFSLDLYIAPLLNISSIFNNYSAKVSSLFNQVPFSN